MLGGAQLNGFVIALRDPRVASRPLLTILRTLQTDAIPSASEGRVFV
jgi:hypothetical protein